MPLVEFLRPVLSVLREEKACMSSKCVSQCTSQLKSFLYTILLFSLSDIRTMLFPICLFGILSAFAGPAFTIINVPASNIFANLPELLFWTWLNILILSISNQREPEGIVEDKLNKPWRPIAAGRITPNAARQIQLFVVPAVIAYGAWLGIFPETLACLCGNWFYNDLGGANEHFLVRNVVNGVAYLAYGAAAFKLATGAGPAEVTPEFYSWLCVVALVVGTTIQLQDLKDLDGDKARGRHTAPVILGAGNTRASVCIGVMFWSIFCPLYWALSLHSAALFISAGALLSARVCLWRNAKADRMSFLMWSWWVMGVFALPLLG